MDTCNSKRRCSQNSCFYATGIAQRRRGATYVDPNTGNAIADPVDRLGENAGTANEPDTACIQNAPSTECCYVATSNSRTTSAVNLLGNYPQVDISLATSNFNKVRELQGFETAAQQTVEALLT